MGSPQLKLESARWKEGEFKTLKRRFVSALPNSLDTGYTRPPPCILSYRPNETTGSPQAVTQAIAAMQRMAALNLMTPWPVHGIDIIFPPRALLPKITPWASSNPLPPEASWGWLALSNGVALQYPHPLIRLQP